jgi:hypothetical protein
MKADRIYPDESKSNQIAALVYWFYVDFLGKSPDATSYSAGTKMLTDVMKPSKTKFPGARSYTAKQIADLFYHLRDGGVIVDGLQMAKTNGLLMAFVDGDTDTVDRIIAYFNGQGNGKKEEWTQVQGW